MSQSAAITLLRNQMSGHVFTAEDAGYDDARRVWNASIDRRPAVIAQCRSPQDVAAAVRFAVDAGLEIAVRGGAHSVSGQSVVDGGLMIDLSKLNAVAIDPEARRARCGGGALLGDVSAAAQEHGLAYPVGTVSHTGVGGLTLGGGMGWLSRKHGLSIDSLTSAEVVTADGRILRADDSTNSDLFWAIRGGGGNFGVVTEFEFALHPVGPMIHFAIVFWSLEQGAAVLRHARDVVGSLPDETNVVIGALSAPPMPFVPEEMHFAPGYAAVVAGFGSESEHQEVVNRLREAAPPMFEHATPMPYMALSTMLDEANAWGFHYYDKACYVEDLSDDVIDVLVEQVPRKTSPMSIALFFRLDNGYSAVGDDETAFSGGRSPRYNLFTIAAAPDPQLLQTDRTWVRELMAALAPHTIDGAYINGLDEEGNEDRVQASYGAQKYARLAAIKAKYDPDNVFRRNANIKPAAQVPAQRVDLTETESSRAR